MVHIYNGNILTCAKMGTRYLDDHLGERLTIHLYDLILHKKYRNTLDYIIIKNPYEYITSAINTYIRRCTVEGYTINGANYIEELLTGNDTHWIIDYFNIIYSYSLLNKKAIFVELDDLSNFIFFEMKNKPTTYAEDLHKTKGYIVYNLERKKSRFPELYDDTKIDLFDFLNSVNPKYHDIVKKLLENQTVFYSKIKDSPRIYRRQDIVHISPTKKINVII